MGVVGGGGKKVEFGREKEGKEGREGEKERGHVKDED